MKLSRPLRLQPLAAAIALTIPVAGYAQLEEIIVTAERRAASELATAISVEVFTQAQLNMDRLQTVDDLQNMTPNLTVNYQGFTIQSVNIRGVGNAVGNPNIQPGVVVMKDGMIAGETVVIQQNFLDVESIEILRGPQGTFVGQASTGGAVVINAARPNFDGVNGWIEARMGDYADSKLSGAINLPLTENVSTRFAFSNETRDSYYNNNLVHEQGPPTYWETGLHPGNMDSQSFRASILFQPHDRLSVLGRAEFNTIWSDSDAPYQPNPRPFINPNDPTGFGQSRYYAYTESQLSGEPFDPYTIAHNVRDGYMESVTNLFSLDVTYNFQNGLQFNSRTGYQDNDLRTTGDTDATRITAQHWRIDVGPDNDYYNQEFTLLSPGDNRMTWIVGTAWYHRFTPVQVATDYWNNPCGYQSQGGHIVECLFEDHRPHQRTMADVYTIQRHAGLFGQLTYDISDTLELEFGARMSWDNNVNYLRVHVAFDTLAASAPPPFRNNPFPCSDPEFIRPAPFDEYACINPVTFGASYSKFKEDEPTWKIGLNWTPGDEHFIYGFYSRGYKSGGVDGGSTFLNEIVDHYEFGYKSTLLDGRMQVQAAAFYMDYQKMQQEAFLIQTTPGLLSNDDGIINIGDSTIDGVELEIDAQFGNLGLNFGAGLVNSSLGGITTVDPRLLNLGVVAPGNNWRRGCAPGEAVGSFGAGDEFPCFDYANSVGFVNLASADNLFSPNVSWNVAIDYAIELSNGATVRPRMSYSYADAAYSSLFQADDFFRTDERKLTNLSISYERDAWAAYLFCNNCAEEVYITSAINTTPARVVYNPPRTMGVRFRYDFE